ncbi:MAG: NitT/TauT family transport system permease protein, partial [Myxococcales bacterium]|nr:NitT/TauT family transport system permease protein [Myxococcales bacterium]
MDRRNGAVGRYALAVLAHLALVVAWFALVKLGHVPRFVLPSPLETVQALGESNYGWWGNIAVTAREIFGGF